MTMKVMMFQSQAVRVLQSMERILTTSNVTCHQQQLTQFGQQLVISNIVLY